MLMRSIGPSMSLWDRPLGWVGPFDDVIENLFTPSRSAAAGPRFVSHDDGQALRLAAELPGISEQDFEVSVEGQTLTVSGRRHTQAPEGYRYLRRERDQYGFSRSFTLPNYLDLNGVEAELEDGVLRILIPRRPEAQPRQIPVQVS